MIERCKLCRDEKGARVLTSLSSSHLSLVTQLFLIYNRVQRYEFFPRQTVWKCVSLCPYLNDYRSSSLSITPPSSVAVRNKHKHIWLLTAFQYYPSITQLTQWVTSHHMESHLFTKAEECGNWENYKWHYMQNILRIISSIYRGIPNVKHHWRWMVGNRGWGLIQRTLTVPWVRFGVNTKQKHVFWDAVEIEKFWVRWETSESDVWLATACFILFTNQPFNCLITYSS